LALAGALTRLGKDVLCTVASSIPPRYSFLDPAGRVVPYQPPGTAYRDRDAVIVLDTGTWNQLGDFGELMRGMPAAKAVIDHHVTQDDLGATRFVDTSAEAAGRLAHEAIMALGNGLAPEEAHALFIALAMDTGWFRHPNTTPATFALASDLVEAGARPTPAYEELFERSNLGRLKLTALVLGRLELAHGGRTCLMSLKASDYAEAGAVPQDSEDLVNYPRSVAGTEVGLFLMEQPRGGIKASFRARTLDVARIAEQFGGGGHKLASGATLPGPLEEAKRRVLAAVGAALDALPT
ncbi:MAG: bifunctional oligoribonuclease/PAP phosphatase NrnA, partial [Gemmataceae bacterium]|nr:bifunctional oligoribonuclease/PAP phosphatase NrnA [Gemmataceae bacterium]